MKPFSEESSHGLVDPSVIGVLGIYSLGGHDQLPPVVFWSGGMFTPMRRRQGVIGRQAPKSPRPSH